MCNFVRAACQSGRFALPMAKNSPLSTISMLLVLFSID